MHKGWLFFAILVTWFLTVTLRVAVGITVVGNWPVWVITLIMSAALMFWAGRVSKDLFRKGLWRKLYRLFVNGG